MSKFIKEFFLFFIPILLIPHFLNNSYAQSIEVYIKIDKGSVLSVSGRNSGANVRRDRKNLSFLRSSVGIDDLAARISDVKLIDDAGISMPHRKFIAGEFVGEKAFSQWSYKIDVAALKDTKAAAHVSWISGDTGILMLDDLLPQFRSEGGKTSAKVTLDLPDGWRAFTSNRMTYGNNFDLPDLEKSVIFIGKGLLELPVAVAGARLNLLLDGDWNFTHKDAADVVREIYSEYRNLFGSDPGQDIYIGLVKFPKAVNPGVWQAETRGRNITIISSDMPFKAQSVQRLHEQLRHEVFHLWLPNAVNLSGNYDWFYEGFALYQSLKTGVQLNRIGFTDFLDTLSRAHNIDSMQTQRSSLIEASANRWNGSDTHVYARGMLVAFLCDIALLGKSKGNTSVSHVIREIFEKNRFPNQRRDGNTAILEGLRADGRLSSIVAKYIMGAEKIDWESNTQTVGLENDPGNARTSLRVKEKPNGRQKVLLNKLGYNNWRKMPRKSE